jgi:hypothetical protein
MSIKIKNKRAEDPEGELNKKIGLFDKTPDSCLTCQRPFDKEDKQMALTWYVVVREEKKQVNLYCPSCWDRANKFLEEMKNEKPNS